MSERAFQNTIRIIMHNPLTLKETEKKKKPKSKYTYVDP